MRPKEFLWIALACGCVAAGCGLSCHGSGPEAREVVISGPMPVGAAEITLAFDFYDSSTGELAHRIVQRVTSLDGFYVVRIPAGPLELGRPYAASVTPLSEGVQGDEGGGGGSPATTYIAYRTVQLQDTTPGRQQVGHFNISGTGIAGAFQGDGSRLTNVNADMLDGMNSSEFAPAAHTHSAADITSGKLADARLSANVALLGNSQTFSGEKTFSTAPFFSAAGAPFHVESTAKVTGLNADMLDGLDSSEFLMGIPNPLALSGSEPGGAIISAVNSADTDDCCGLFGESIGSSGLTYGVWGRTEGLGGGVLGQTVCPYSNAAGVVGMVDSGTGVIPAKRTAILGESADGFGVLGSTETGRGVVGVADWYEGVNYGVWGQSDSSEGRGVYGFGWSSIGPCFGVYGETRSSEGTAVYGDATSESGLTLGVHGRSASSSGIGVLGEATTEIGLGAGVYGWSTSMGGVGVYGWSSATQGETYGGWFQCESPDGTAVEGYANSATGLSCGVRGYSWSSSGYGVYGQVDNGAFSAGVRGQSYAQHGNGVIGVAHTGTSAIGLLGASLDGYAGYFEGKVSVYGDLYVSGTKTGYVSDIVLNIDDEPLEPGDLVEIAGYGDPVLGDIPVILVRKTRSAGSRAVLGPIVCALEVEECEKLQAEHPTQAADGETYPVYRIARAAGEVAPDQYAHVVTLGAFKMMKVDASYGPIEPGDLLVSSPNPGYAMRDDDPRVGTVIGKALGALDRGTGTVPVLVQAR